MPDPLHHFGYRFPTGCRAILALLAALASPALAPTQGQDPLAAAPAVRLPLILTWGHQSPAPHDFLIRLAGSHLTVSPPNLERAEAGDSLHDGTARTRAGGGDVDGLVCELRFEPHAIHAITNAQSIWNHLFQHGNPGAARRLQSDPAFRPDPRQLTVHLDESGTRGFTLTADQLLSQKSFWLPELDLFLTAGTNPPSFAEFQAQREPQRGQRVLDRLATEPEATYAQYTARWEDMGHPGFRNPHSIPPGHIVGIGWDSGLYKFGVDRLARVHHDYAKADQFELGLDFGGPETQLEAAWQRQQLAEGLPILTTTFEKDGVRCDIEQFACPLDGPPSERRGDLKMVLLQQTTLTELRGTPRTVPVRIAHGRALSQADSRISARVTPTHLALEDELGDLLLGVEGPLISPETTDVTPAPPEREKTSPLPLRRHQVLSSVALPARGTVVLTLRLPSPTLAAGEQAKLFALDYLACRTATAKFWNDQLAQGAHFEVPEQAVNTLFRANLWHARRLPRRHGGPGPEVKIDLPYSNFAYDQFGTPWPVNQSVYVDYMLYDLRGHHDLSEEEHAAIYRNNQETNGHVGGFANWGVYSPGMLYSVAQHALLSGDRASFERLLPATLRALDWCLGEMRRAGEPGNPAPGLVLAPLNDLSHDPRSWAFNQAYFVAGVDLLGRALAEIQHPRAAECR
ncbi:MAG: hypothetical protein IT580_13345, partial [Verrucomicrobiales bacterium]|nr:hypothetical protein [Verrucomicrobiales bacterium]